MVIDHPNKAVSKTILLCCLFTMTRGFVTPPAIQLPRSSSAALSPPPPSCVSPPKQTLHSNSKNSGRHITSLNLKGSPKDDDKRSFFSPSPSRSVTPPTSITPTAASCWNPPTRKTLIALSSLGATGTAYLTYLKLFQTDGIANLCGSSATASSSSCASVLDSPYATLTLGGGDVSVPLTAVGCLAYVAVALLSLFPLLSAMEEEGDDSNNRTAILCITTTMATFSLYLLSLLFNVLHQSCPYCLASAAISVSMAFIAWINGCLPTDDYDFDPLAIAATNNANSERPSKDLGLGIGLGSFTTATAAALLLFFNGGDIPATQAQTSPSTASSSSSSSLVFAKANDPKPPQNVPPPPITATSSTQALSLARKLQSLDAKMYGAYWCSHCFDQKQTMGREAMKLVTYVECAKEGKDSQRDLCQEKKVPGFPTWDIGGKLYPGEWGLDELEEIVDGVMKDGGKK